MIMLLFYEHGFDYDVDVCLGVFSSLSIVLVDIIIISISMYSWVRTNKVNLFTNFTKSLTIKQPFLRHNCYIVLMMGDELSEG